MIIDPDEPGLSNHSVDHSALLKKMLAKRDKYERDGFIERAKGADRIAKMYWWALHEFLDTEATDFTPL